MYSISKSLSCALIALSFSNFVLCQHPFRVINRCSQVIWAGTFGNNEIPEGGSFRLNPNEQRSFTVKSGWEGGRIWGKTGCDDAGRNCVTGDAPSGGRTTLQAVTLAEFGLDTSFQGLDAYDISLVDGFNIPITIKPFGTVNSDNCRNQGCNFDFGVCPESFKEYRNNQVVACKSACTATRDLQYCCPGDKVKEEDCHPSEYSEIFKRQCNDAYTWAYDFKNSDRHCRGKSFSGYEVVFCG